MPKHYQSPSKTMPKPNPAGRRAKTTEDLLKEMEEKRKKRDKAVNKK